MDTIQQATTGLGLMFNMNWDRILNVVVLILALVLGAWVGTVVNEAFLVPLRTH